MNFGSFLEKFRLDLMPVSIAVLMAFMLFTHNVYADNTEDVEPILQCDSDFVKTSAHRVCRAFEKELNLSENSDLRKDILEGKVFVSVDKQNNTFKGFEFPEWKQASEESLIKLKKLPVAEKFIKEHTIKDSEIEETTIDFDNFGNPEKVLRLKYMAGFRVGKMNIPSAMCFIVENSTNYDLSSSQQMYPSVSCNYLTFKNRIYSVGSYKGVTIDQYHIDRLWGKDAKRYSLMNTQSCELTFNSILPVKHCKNENKGK